MPLLSASHVPVNVISGILTSGHVPWYTPYMTQTLDTPIGTIDIIDVRKDVQDVVVIDMEQVIPPLTLEESNFALAVIECGGNVAAAYRMAFGKDVDFPLAKGKELLGKAGVALKIRDITEAVADAALISVGAHLNELAEIRDLSKAQGNMKVALAAEVQRGQAVGIYQKFDAQNVKNSGGNTQINIHLASPHDQNI